MTPFSAGGAPNLVTPDFTQGNSGARSPATRINALCPRKPAGTGMTPFSAGGAPNLFTPDFAQRNSGAHSPATRINALRPRALAATGMTMWVAVGRRHRWSFKRISPVIAPRAGKK